MGCITGACSVPRAPAQWGLCRMSGLGAGEALLCPQQSEGGRERQRQHAGGCVWQGTDWNSSTAALYLAQPKDFLFLHITSAADTRQHPLLTGREQQSWAKYPPKSSWLIQRVRHGRWLRFSKSRLGGFYAVQSDGAKGWGERMTPQEMFRRPW